jgi:hypothetical protein
LVSAILPYSPADRQALSPAVALFRIQLMVEGLAGNTQVTHHAYPGELRLGTSLARIAPDA